MRNPVTMLREQLNPAELNKKAEQPLSDVEKEQIAKVKGELAHQHQGWLEHPITLESLKKLERDLMKAEENMAYLALNHQIPDSFIRGLVMQWAIQKVNFHSIKTTQLIFS